MLVSVSFLNCLLLNRKKFTDKLADVDYTRPIFLISSFYLRAVSCRFCTTKNTLLRAKYNKFKHRWYGARIYVHSPNWIVLRKHMHIRS